jgi:hypothetical protein
MIHTLMPVNQIGLHSQESYLVLTDRGIPPADVTQILVLRRGDYNSEYFKGLTPPGKYDNNHKHAHAGQTE